MLSKFKNHSRDLKRFAKRATHQYWSKIVNFFYFYEDIPIKLLCNKKGGVIRYFGKTNKYYYIDNNEKSFQKDPISGKPIFLKIDRISKYTLMCVQHWVHVSNELGCDIYFVCDNKKLERLILKEIEFKKLNFKFVPSARNQLRYLGAYMYSYYWRNATYAHLTPFFIAKQLGIKRFWAIDGDDTTFLNSPKIVADNLVRAEKYAIDNDLAAFSLDMWTSRSPYDSWTMGIMFINDIVNFFSIFEETKSRDWIKEFGQKRNINIKVANLDHFFTHLNDIGKIKAKAFYFENTTFIHWDDNIPGIKSKICTQIFHWENNKLYLPMFGAVPQTGVNYDVEYDVKAIKI